MLTRCIAQARHCFPLLLPNWLCHIRYSQTTKPILLFPKFNPYLCSCLLQSHLLHRLLFPWNSRTWNCCCVFPITACNVFHLHRVPNACRRTWCRISSACFNAISGITLIELLESVYCSARQDSTTTSTPASSTISVLNAHFNAPSAAVARHAASAILGSISPSMGTAGSTAMCPEYNWRLTTPTSN